MGGRGAYVGEELFATRRGGGEDHAFGAEVIEGGEVEGLDVGRFGVGRGGLVGIALGDRLNGGRRGFRRRATTGEGIEEPGSHG